MNELIIFGATNLIAGIVAGTVVELLADKKNRIKLGVILILALPLGYVMARIAGMIFNHHQPFAELGFTPLVPHDVDNSFPSDHTLIAGIFASVAFLSNKWFGLAMWLLALLVGLARVAAGLHWSVDVLMSCALALLAVAVAHQAVKLSGYFK